MTDQSVSTSVGQLEREWRKLWSKVASDEVFLGDLKLLLARCRFAGRAVRQKNERKRLQNLAETVAREIAFKSDCVMPDFHILTPETFAASSPETIPLEANNSRRYLIYWEKETRSIDSPGSEIVESGPKGVSVDSVYIPLRTGAPSELSEQRRYSDDRFTSEEDGTVLEKAVLERQRVVVLGEAGSGKTVLLRRITNTLCRGELGIDLSEASSVNATFPIFVSLSELANHVQRSPTKGEVGYVEDSPQWFIDYLAFKSKEYFWGLDEEFFREKLERGESTVLFDGLDEAPGSRMREAMARLVENIAIANPECRFIVTCRPAGYSSKMLTQFECLTIDALSRSAVLKFLLQWRERNNMARELLRDIYKAIVLIPSIESLSRNPLMLTAMVMVHWRQGRLPEQRAELYENTVHWLSRSRSKKSDGTGTIEIKHLQDLALAMQSYAEEADWGGRTQFALQPHARYRRENHRSHMRTGMPWRWAVNQITKGLGNVRLAERYLDDLERDSGIIRVKQEATGPFVVFRHRIFQEFLAAKAVAELEEEQRFRVLGILSEKSESILYADEWREVVLLLAGLLHQQDESKVDHLVNEVIHSSRNLETRVKAAALVGAIERELNAFGYLLKGRALGDKDQSLHKLLEEVSKTIFDSKRPDRVDMETYIEAADTLRWHYLPHRDEWVPIPETTFKMGASSDPSSPYYDGGEHQWDAHPRHEVPLSDYCIARYPVTVAQYQEFVEDNGYDVVDEEENESKVKDWWTAGRPGLLLAPKDWEDQLLYPLRPVVGISWYEAVAFSVWYNAKYSPPDGFQYRLPTEAEWEHAARGDEDSVFPWGPGEPNSERLNCRFPETASDLTPVGVYPLGATPLRICDMSGNVWEWCLDRFLGYADEDWRNPCTEKGEGRVLRGGSFASRPKLCRATVRLRAQPRIRFPNVGFRLVLAGPIKVAGDIDQSELAPEPKTILVVTTNARVYAEFGKVLDEHGFNHVWAEDGTRAYKKINAKTPGLIALDVELDEMASPALYEALRGDNRLKRSRILVFGAQMELDIFAIAVSRLPPPDDSVATTPRYAVRFLDKAKTLLTDFARSNT